MEQVYPTIEELNNDREVQCTQCNKTFTNSSALRLHRVKFHRVVANGGDRRLFCRSETTNDIIKEVRFYCPAEGCREKNVSFKDISNLRQHYTRAHGRKTLECECGTRFALEKDRRYHKKARCPLRTRTEVAPETSGESRGKPKPKASDDVHLVDSGFSANSSGTNGHAIVMIVPTGNVSETIRQITNALKSKATVGIQAAEEYPTTSTIGVGEPATEFCDFSGQYNLEPESYYYQEQVPEVRHISTVTDFSIPFLDSDFQAGESYLYTYTQQAEALNAMNENPFIQEGQQPLKRSFGTTMAENDFADSPRAVDFLRENETQTTDFWKELEEND